MNCAASGRLLSYRPSGSTLFLRLSCNLELFFVCLFVHQEFTGTLRENIFKVVMQ